MLGFAARIFRSLLVLPLFGRPGLAPEDEVVFPFFRIWHDFLAAFILLFQWVEMIKNQTGLKN
jgi:hypothetical protein